jgi:hypothetical protein
MIDETETARRRANLALIVSVISVGIAGVSLVISGVQARIASQNRADAAEQVVVTIAKARGEPEMDVQTPTGALVAKDKIITVHAKRVTWEVLVSNTSLSADLTVIGIWRGQNYTPVEPVYDELTKITSELSGVPTLPKTLRPSETMSFKLVTKTPETSDHVPFVEVSTSRGRQVIGTPTP